MVNFGVAEELFMYHTNGLVYEDLPTLGICQVSYNYVVWSGNVHWR